MLKKSKRILSLVLALIMICSTMGVMSFAQERANFNKWCYECGTMRNYLLADRVETLNRIIECPTHSGHDAEKWYCDIYYECEVCSYKYIRFTEIEYRCIW